MYGWGINAGHAPRHAEKLFIASALFVTAILLSACFGVVSGRTTTSNVKPGSTTLPPSLTTQLFAGGLHALQTGEYVKALEDFEIVISIAPKDKLAVTEANFDVGVVYTDEGDDLAADDYFAKALSVTPTYQPALIDLALLETKADPQKALSLYQRLEKVDPNDPSVDTDYGNLLITVGETVLGKEELAIAKSLNASKASSSSSSASTTSTTAKASKKHSKSASSSSTSST
jgi:tetratricopeptide (TPR) repeat protein